MQTAMTQHADEAAFTGSVGRDIELEMAQYMRENPGCTTEDMHNEGGFDWRQIDQYRFRAAELASRLSTRRVA